MTGFWYVLRLILSSAAAGCMPRRGKKGEAPPRRSAEVVADNVYFGDSRRDSDGSSGGNYANNSYGGNNGGYSAPAGGYSAPAGGYAAPVGGSGFSEIDEEDGDLPF